MLGRLIALPLMLLALALQGLAPAAAAAMPHDAFGEPICSARLLAAGLHDQGNAHQHDCCTGVCSLAAMGATPATAPAIARVAYGDGAAPWTAPAATARNSRAVPTPRARGPPASI